MNQERVETTTITLYPSQRAKIERIMRYLKLRSFSQAVQRVIEEAPEPPSENQAAQIQPGG